MTSENPTIFHAIGTVFERFITWYLNLVFEEDLSSEKWDAIIGIYVFETEWREKGWIPATAKIEGVTEA